MNYRSLFSIIVVSLCLQSCIYDSLKPCNGDYYGELRIVNDWRYAPDADPAGMAYLFYSPAYSDPWRFDISGMSGGEIKIPTGHYSMVSFNDDTSRIKFLNEESYDKIAVSTYPTGIYPGAQPGVVPDELLKDIKDRNVLLTPDHVWSCADDEVAIENIRNNETLYVYPRQMTKKYHLEIRNIRNSGSLKSITGALSGMASSVNICSGNASQEAAVNPFDISYDKASDTLYADLLTFGRTADTTVKNYLFLFATLTDGKRCMFEFDVTDIILNSSDPFNVKIIIDGLEIPEAGDPEGTFEVNVDGWNIIRIDIAS